MIFATVGTQLPFDRLIAALDAWAAAHRHIEIFAQIGCGDYLPRHMAWTRVMEPGEFRGRIASCETVVAHAGMGSIISAIELGKRVIVMPRRASLGEHRNEHQLATVARLAHLRRFDVVHEAAELDAALAFGHAQIDASVRTVADPGLIAAIRSFAGLEAA